MSRKSNGAFGARLNAVLHAGNLRVADLARWFDVPYHTAREWVENHRDPSGGPLDKERVHDLLGALELRVKKKQGFPVPRLSPSQRIAHLKGIRKQV